MQNWLIEKAVRPKKIIQEFYKGNEKRVFHANAQLPNSLSTYRILTIG